MKNMLYLAMAILIILTSTIQVVASNEFSCADVTEIPQIECEALVALYNSTNGPGWTNNPNWLVTNTPSTWYGVTLDHGHVTRLDLRLNGLRGVIPPELAKLLNLEYLDLSYNLLSGSFPPELGNLTSLNSLWLNSNQLSGTIPSELGNLTSLLYLILYGNQLSGSIPPELGNLTSVNSLCLDSNQLSGNVPPELGNLTSLYHLDLSSNQLSGNVPPELGNLTSLYYLDLSSNQLSGTIPSKLGNLTSLNDLYLSDNQLSGNIPPELSNLVNLDRCGQVGGGPCGLELGYNLLIVPLGYPDWSNPFHLFLYMRDTLWHQHQGFEQVIGSGGGKLISLDGKTAFSIPFGALDSDATFFFMPQPAPHHGSSKLVFANNGFLLTAKDAIGNQITTFNIPITVTLTYNYYDIIGIPESTLHLYYWDTSASVWQDVVTTCPGGEYTRDLAGNSFTLPQCHLTEFGVFGTPIQTFLPDINR